MSAFAVYATSSQMLRRWNRTKYLAHPEIRRLISSITSSNYVQARCASLPIMEFRDTVHNFVDEARQILERLRTGEGETLSGPDLHILEVQLYLAWKRSHQDERSQNPTSFSSVRIWPGKNIAALSNQCQALLDRRPHASCLTVPVRSPRGCFLIGASPSVGRRLEA